MKDDGLDKGGDECLVFFCWASLSAVVIIGEWWWEANKFSALQMCSCSTDSLRRSNPPTYSASALRRRLRMDFILTFYIQTAEYTMRLLQFFGIGGGPMLVLGFFVGGWEFVPNCVKVPPRNHRSSSALRFLFISSIALGSASSSP